MPWSFSGSKLCGRGLVALLVASLPACDCQTTLRIASPRIEVSPASLDFGTVALGQLSELPLNVTNVGQGPLDVSNATIALTDFGVPAAQFLATDCEGNPRSGSSKNVISSGECARLIVSYAPKMIETVTTKVVITSNDPKDPTVDVPITAKAADIPCLQVTPATTMDFGTIGEGTTKELPLTVENCGKIPFSITELSLNPANTRLFSVTGVPTLPLMLMPSGSGHINVTYAPSMATGSTPDTAEINIATDTSQIPMKVVNLIGRATGPECGNSAAPTAKVQVFDGSSPIGANVLPLTMVTLDGTQSTAPGSSIAAYEWTLVGSPANNMSTIVGTGARVQLQCTLAGTYKVQLTVKSAAGCTATTEVSIQVVPGAGIHVQLTWPEAYGDQDLHYVAPGGVFSDDPAPEGGDLYYIYAAATFDSGTLTQNPFNPTIDWGRNNTYQPDGNPADDPSLDADQLWGKGPENVTHPHPFDADYQVMVHYYCSSDFDQPTSSCANGGTCMNYGNGTPTVTIYFNGKQIWQGSTTFSAKEVWDAATIHVTSNGNAATVTAGTKPPYRVSEGCDDGF